MDRFNFLLEFHDQADSIKYQKLYRKQFPFFEFLLFHSFITFFQFYIALKNDFSPPYQIFPLRIDNLFFFVSITLNGYFLLIFHWIHRFKEVGPSWNSIISRFEIMYIIFGALLPGMGLLIRSIYDDQYCVPNIEKCNILHDFHYLHPALSTMTLFAPYCFITFLNSPYKRFNFISWIISIAIIITSIVVSGNHNSFLLVIMAFVMLLTSYQSEKQNILAFLAFMQASETEIKLDLSVKAMEMKRAYYRYISHEIRTPLSVANLGLNLIEIEVQSLGGDCSQSVEIKANVKYCQDAVQSAVSILNDLIENEKLESKLLNLESEPHSFSPILSSVMGPFMLMSREKRISLSVDFAVDRYFNLPGLSAVLPASSLSAPVSLLGSVSSSDSDLSKCYSELPPSAFPSPESSLPLESVLPSGLIFADQHKIAQVVRNLVSNALKFTPKGGEVAILVSYLTEQNEWAKSVLDEKQKQTNSIKINNNQEECQKVSLNRGFSSQFTLRSPTGKPSTFPSLMDEESSSHSTLTFFSASDFLQSFRGSRVHSTNGSEIDPNLFRKNSPIIQQPSISKDSFASHPITGVLLVEVVDSGAGIKAEDQSLLFAEAVQIDAGKLQGGGGSGLGLYNSRRIVEMHGGGMGMRSEGTGKGCTFFFWLPLYHPNSSPLNPVEVNNYLDHLFEQSSRPISSGSGSSSIRISDQNQHPSSSHPSSDESLPLNISQHSSTRVTDQVRTSFDSFRKFVGFVDSTHQGSSTRHSQSMNMNQPKHSSSYFPRIYRYHFQLHSNLTVFSSSVSSSLRPSSSFFSHEATTNTTTIPLFQISKSLRTQQFVPQSPLRQSSSTMTPPTGIDFETALSHPSISSIEKFSNDLKNDIEINSIENIALTQPSPPISSSACLSLSSETSPALSRLVLSSVLLVEDSDLVRKLTRKTLEAGKSGNSCFEARNGREAVEMVRERLKATQRQLIHRQVSTSFPPFGSSETSYPHISSPLPMFSGEFGLVLIDSVMPEMSGPEATQALREMGYRGLIVGLTGNAMEEDTAHFKALGASAVLAKPLDYQQLVQVVREYLMVSDQV